MIRWFFGGFSFSWELPWFWFFCVFLTIFVSSSSRLYQCKEFASCEAEIASRAGVGRIIERNPNEMTCLLRDFLGANSSRPKSRVWQLLYLKAKKKRKEKKKEQQQYNSQDNNNGFNLEWWDDALVSILPFFFFLFFQTADRQNKINRLAAKKIRN